MSKNGKELERKRLTPKETIHAWCHYCVKGRSDSEVENCGGHLVYATGKTCPFFLYRMGKRPPMKVFRQFCLECMGGSSALVRECNSERCPMHPYRFGTNPARTGIGGVLKRRSEVRFDTVRTATLSQGF